MIYFDRRLTSMLSYEKKKKGECIMPVEKDGRTYIISADLRWLLQKVLGLDPKQARGIVGPKWKLIVAATPVSERIELNRVERKVGGTQRDIVQYGVSVNAFVNAADKAGIIIKNFDISLLPRNYGRTRASKTVELDFSKLR
jgi:hypothetical protein